MQRSSPASSHSAKQAPCPTHQIGGNNAELITCFRPQREATTSTGPRISVSLSMGTTPAATISARLRANLGSTRPAAGAERG
eukprot:1148558-Pelagomonas_calceolata.AAC.2